MTIAGPEGTAQATLRRVARILTAPEQEWSAIAAETSRPATVLLAYVLPLAALPAIGWMLGLALAGDHPHFGLARGIVSSPSAILAAGAATFVGAVVSVLVLAAALGALAPMYGAPRDFARTFRVAAFAATPVLLAGVLLVLPLLAIVAVPASLYAAYLCWLGAQWVIGVRRTDAAEYVMASGVVAVVASVAIGALCAAAGW